MLLEWVMLLFLGQGLETPRDGSSGDGTTDARSAQQWRHPRRLSRPRTNAIDFCCEAHRLDFGTGRVNTDTSIYWCYSRERGHLPKTRGGRAPLRFEGHADAVGEEGLGGWGWGHWRDWEHWEKKGKRWEKAILFPGRNRGCRSPSECRPVAFLFLFIKRYGRSKFRGFVGFFFVGRWSFPAPSPPTSSSITPKGRPRYRNITPTPFADSSRSFPPGDLGRGESRRKLAGEPPLPRCSARAAAKSSSRARAALISGPVSLLPRRKAALGNPCRGFIGVGARRRGWGGGCE